MTNEQLNKLEWIHDTDEELQSLVSLTDKVLTWMFLLRRMILTPSRIQISEGFTVEKVEECYGTDKVSDLVQLVRQKLANPQDRRVSKPQQSRKLAEWYCRLPEKIPEETREICEWVDRPLEVELEGGELVAIPDSEVP